MWIKIFNEVINTIQKANLFSKFALIYKNEIIYSNFNPSIDKYLTQFIKKEKEFKVNQFIILNLVKYSFQFVIYKITSDILFLGNTIQFNHRHKDLLIKITNDLISPLIKNVQISTAGVLGPKPQLCYPDADDNFKNLIAMKSLILLAGNQDDRNLSSSIIPISDNIAFVYLFYIEHPEGRGGIFDASISVIVDKMIQDLLIKSMSDLDDYISKYIKLANISLDKNGDIIEIKEPIQKLYNQIKKLILKNAEPIQIYKFGDTKTDIDEFKKSLDELKKMLSKYE